MLFVRRFLASSAISKPAERSIKISGGLVWTGKWIRRRQQHYSRRYGDYLTGRPVAELSLMPQAGRGRLGLVYATTERSGDPEEHTSELQSLMRISYAVFCLKKKHKQHTSSRLTHNT